MSRSRGTAGDRIHTGEPGRRGKEGAQRGVHPPPRVPPPTAHLRAARGTGCGARRQATRAAAAALRTTRGPGLWGWRAPRRRRGRHRACTGADPAPPALPGDPMGHSRDQTLTWLSWGRPPGAAAARGRCRRRHGGLRNRDAGSGERSLQTPVPLLSLLSSLLSILTPPRPRGRPQPNPPSPARAHLKCAFHLGFSSTQISRRRHRWLRPQRRPTNRDSVLARPRRRKAPLCSDRGNWTASARAPQDTYAQLARRSPSRMVLTATGTRFRGKSVEAAFRAFLRGGAGRGGAGRGRGGVLSLCPLGFQTTAPTPIPVTKD